MALVKGTNSYVTVAEADEFFADRLDVAAWTSADATQKAQALVTATAALDSMSWTGTAVSVTQALAFPRNGVYFDPRLGLETSLDPAAVPERVLTATSELAYHLLNNDGLFDNTGSVDAISVGNISLSKVQAPSKIPYSVKRYITPLLLSGGRNIWWRAN
jgi:hypothetical protein